MRDLDMSDVEMDADRMEDALGDLQRDADEYNWSTAPGRAEEEL